MQISNIVVERLAALSAAVFGWLPDMIAEGIPFLQMGIPAVLSIYFDLFSGFVQAFVFCLLTMVYVGAACPPPEEIEEERMAKMEKKAQKKAKRLANK